MLLTIIAIVFAVLRAIGMKSVFFQALAHVYVGALCGAWLVARKRLYLALALTLSAVEVVCTLLL